MGRQWEWWDYLVLLAFGASLKILLRFVRRRLAPRKPRESVKPRQP